MNINMNPDRDYCSVEKQAPHSIACCQVCDPRLLLYGCIPYGMQGTHGIQFSTERYIPMECSIKNNTILNLSRSFYKTLNNRCIRA